MISEKERESETEGRVRRRRRGKRWETVDGEDFVKLEENHTFSNENNCGARKKNWETTVDDDGRCWGT